MVNQTLCHGNDGFSRRILIGTEEVNRLLVADGSVHFVLAFCLFGADLETFGAELVVEGLGNLDLLKVLGLSNKPMVGGFWLVDGFKMESRDIADIDDTLIADADFSLCFVHVVKDEISR